MTLSYVELRDFLIEYFSLEELSTFCANYFREVYEDNDGRDFGKSGYVEWLAAYCVRRDLVNDLESALRKERPKPFFERFGRVISDIELRDFLTEYFTLEELNSFCLEYFPEVFRNHKGTSVLKVIYVRNLVDYCKRYGLIKDLESALRKERRHTFLRKFEFVEDGPVQVRPAAPVSYPVERPVKRSTSELAPSKFKEQFVESFSLDDLRSICFDLGVRFDDIPGEVTLTRKIEELYLLLGRAGKLESLIEKCRALRPGMVW